MRFRPRAVVVAYYLGNDVFNAYEAVYRREAWASWRSSDFEDDAPAAADELKKTTIPLRAIREFLRERSTLYAFVGDRTRLWRERLGISSARNVGVRDWTTTDPEASLLYDERAELETRFWVRSRLRGVNLEDKNIQEGSRLSKAFLSAMDVKAGEGGAELLVVLIPSKASVYREVVGGRALENPLYSQILSYEAIIQRELLAYCVGEGIECVELRTELSRLLEDGLALYHTTWDEHPQEEGYRAYAGAVARTLGELDLLE